MKKKRKWLSWALVTTGVIVALVLILAINSEPLVRWFQVGSSEGGQEREPDTGGARPVAWQDALGTALISVFILALIASHFGLLIAAAKALNKPRPHTQRGPTTCPRCEHSIQRDWRVCPFCGWVLDPGMERSSMLPGSSPRV